MADKLCVFCDHLSLNLEVEHGYYEGDVYPNGFIRCLKGHWTLQHGEYETVQFSRGSLAEAIQTAKTCVDYSPPSLSAVTESKEAS